MVKQITFKNLYQMDKFPFIAALFDPQNISYSNRQRKKNYTDFNIPIKRHRHQNNAFFRCLISSCAAKRVILHEYVCYDSYEQPKSNQNMQLIPLLETMNIPLAPFTRSPPSQILEILDVVKIIHVYC